MKSKCKRAWSEYEIQTYEDQLREVLKKDKDHRFPFDKKMLIHSSRYGCTFAAVDVHLDEKTGELVMVGAVRNGVVVNDEKTGLPKVAKNVSIPFREVYDDLKKFDIPGSEMKFIDKTRKAVLDKYVSAPMLSLQNMYALQGDTFNLSDYLNEDEKKKFTYERMKIRGISFGEDSKINFWGYNEFTTEDIPLSFGQLDLDYLQRVGTVFDSLLNQFNQCKNVFLDRMGELEPVDMSYSDRDIREHRQDAISKMMASDHPESVKYALKNYFLMNNPVLSEREQKNIDSAREFHNRIMG